MRDEEILAYIFQMLEDVVYAVVDYDEYKETLVDDLRRLADNIKSEI